jgi:hypothetical protein
VAPRDDTRTEIEGEERPFRSTPGGFFDSAVVHLVTTATLEHLRTLYPGGMFDPRRFRPNLVIETAPSFSGDVERGWLGSVLSIGDVSLELSTACERCVMTTAAQDELPHDRGILRTVARETGNEVGLYAAVRAPGRIALGDPVSLTRP